MKQKLTRTTKLIQFLKMDIEEARNFPIIPYEYSNSKSVRKLFKLVKSGDPALVEKALDHAYYTS